MIPMVDLAVQHQAIRAELEIAMAGVMRSGSFVLGPNVTGFEQEVARYLGTPRAVAVASGTDALRLALKVLGVGPGQEVVTTPFSFIATAEVIADLGATPVFADIRPDTFDIDADRVREAISPRTAALLPVHLFGQPADLPALQRIADEHGLPIVEDCAQSFGADIDGRFTGTFGAFGCFSFYPTKNLGGCGDGGLVVTPDEDAARELTALRNHGSRSKGRHDVLGLNSRLDELQAAILRVKLRHVDVFNRERRKVARTYDALLRGTGIATPRQDGLGTHVFHQYTVLLPEGMDRDRVIAALWEQNIASSVHYPVPIHRQPVFAERYERVSMPVAEDVARRCLSLPIYPEMTTGQVETVASALTDALSSQS